MGKIIAVWGSPSSGKSTFSIKLAKELASKKKNVIIVFADNNCPVIPTLIQKENSKSLGNILSAVNLTKSDILKNLYTKNVIIVFADNNCPVIPTLIQKENSKSLGNILSAVNLTKSDILKNLYTIDKVNNVTITGYKEYENVYTYPKYDELRVDEFLNIIRFMADYIIIDTSSYFVTDLLSTKSLILADEVIRLITPSLKSMSYFNSSLPILDSANFKKENHINVLSNFRYNDPIEEIKDIYLVKGEFPYMEGIREQSLCTELFFKLKTKEENILSKHMKHKFMHRIIFQIKN